MPWKNDTGNWKGGGGPWGQRPQPPGGQPPDLEELLKRSQDRLRSALPSGGQGNGWIAALVGGVLLLLWLMQSVYTVQPNELAQELVFGQPKEAVSEPGLHFHFWPIETVEIVSTAQQQERIGGGEGARRAASGGSLMLSGDQNVVDVVFTVIWRIVEPRQFLFSVSEPEAFVRRAAESAMREFIGRSRAEDVRTERRADVEDAVRTQLQQTLDAYGAGIQIIGVQLEQADPPAEVADVLEEVQRAQQDQERFQREAEQYANKRLGDARGEAAQVRESARGYRESVIAQAQGEAARFVSIYNEYEKAKDVTRRRIFLETMEQVLRDANKVILGSGAAESGVVPYLPLNEIQRRGATQ